MDKIIIRAENSRTLINLDEPVLTLSNQRIVMDTIDRSPELVSFFLTYYSMERELKKSRTIIAI